VLGAQYISKRDLFWFVPRTLRIAVEVISTNETHAILPGQSYYRELGEGTE
jgi:hypothetical protein